MGVPTNFPIPNFDHSFTVPIFGSAVGKQIFVKPNSGSDADDGLTPDTAVKTLSKAHDLATADRNDVVWLISESSSAGSTSDAQSGTLTWSKDLTHLIGITAPTKVSQRARISQATAADAISPLVNITADSCVFANFQVFHGSSSASSLIAVQVTGDRNYFENVHIAGMGNATQDASGGRSLKVTGEENTFVDCTIGLDTVARGTTEGEVELSGGATRNIFRNCRFTTYLDGSGVALIYVPSNGLDRYTLMEDCKFINMPTGDASGTTGDEVFDVTGGGSPDGIILVAGAGTSFVGFTDIEADTVSGKVMVSVPAASSTGAKAVDAS